MADVFAVFGTLLALGIAFPGFLTAIWLLFSKRVEIAQIRLAKTPGTCFLLGTLVIASVIVISLMLYSLPLGLAKLAGSFLIFLSLTVASIGTAGVACLMGSRLQQGASLTQRDFLRASVALELAAIFPLVGWFVVLPLTLVVSTGAAAFACLRWLPRAEQTTSPQPLPTQA